MQRLLLAFLLLVVGSAATLADDLERIKQRGRVLIGVKSDYPPFGKLTPDGQLVGFDADLAALVGKAIGVNVELVGVNTVNRLQKLDERAIDVVVATLADTERRRRSAKLVEPNYFASGVNMLAPRSLVVADWPELRGRSVCATQGAYFNTIMAEGYLLDLSLYNGIRDASLALADGRCIGYLYDEPALLPLLQDPAWADYHMPLKPVLVSPWGIAVRLGPDSQSLERLIGDLVAGWHRDGTLIDLERKWGLPANDFLARQQALWTRKKADGSYVCTRLADGDWPAECRNQAFVTAEETTGLAALILRVKASTGLDFTMFTDHYERSQLLRGLLMTIGLIVASVVGCNVFGFLMAAIVDARVPIVSRALMGLATFGRMTPPLLQIYVIFFGVGSLLVSHFGIGLPAFAVAALCLAFYAGSANVAALVDAAAVLRLQHPEARVGRRFLAPLTALAYPSLMANTVNIVKATGMASAIAVPEIINASTSILAEHGNGGVVMNLLMLTYFLLVYGTILVLSALQRRVTANVAV